MRPLRKFLLSLYFVAFAWPAGRAHADPPKRAPQDYGAPDPGTSAGEVALWVPRVVFFPLWLVSEFLVRRPLGALVKVAEKGEWAQELIDFFTFGERQQITIYPSALFDFGLLPSVGFNFTHKYFITDPNTVRFHFGTWGIDWISVRANDTYEFGKGETVTVDASFVRRQDNPFYGMGPRAGTDRARFDSTTVDAGLEYNRRLWRSSSFVSRGGFRLLSIDEGTCCDDPSLHQAIARGRFTPPPGFEDGYLAGYHRLSLALDSRRPKPAEGSGVRIEAHGEGTYAPDTRRGYERRAWVRYGGSVGAAVDVTGHERNVAVSVSAELADPLNGTIPFTDQVTLGGDTLMRGYLRNRLIDRSALVGTFQYTWPVWVYLDGVITVDAGNVFGEHLSGFKPGLLRLSSGIGVRSNGHRDSAFEILVAGGTDPLDEGFSVSSFRLVLGSHHGF
jgi:hypothetical protein